MNRLTKVESSSVLIKDGWKKKDTESYTSICYGCEEIGRCVNKCGFYKALEKLADYEDLEEQGLLIKLPCKVGDTVYIVGSKYRKGTLEKWVNTGKFKLSDIEKLGETVFLTREKAEKALLEVQK